MSVKYFYSSEVISDRWSLLFFFLSFDESVRTDFIVEFLFFFFFFFFHSSIFILTERHVDMHALLFWRKQIHLTLFSRRKRLVEEFHGTFAQRFALKNSRTRIQKYLQKCTRFLFYMKFIHALSHLNTRNLYFISFLFSTQYRKSLEPPFSASLEFNLSSSSLSYFSHTLILSFFLSFFLDLSLSFLPH